jgi:hypothetical protein
MIVDLPRGDRHTVTVPAMPPGAVIVIGEDGKIRGE